MSRKRPQSMARGCGGNNTRINIKATNIADNTTATTPNSNTETKESTGCNTQNLTKKNSASDDAENQGFSDHVPNEDTVSETSEFEVASSKEQDVALQKAKSEEDKDSSGANS